MKSNTQTIFNVLVVIIIAILAAPMFGYQWQMPLVPSAQVVETISAAPIPTSTVTCVTGCPAVAEIAEPVVVDATTQPKNYCAFAGGRWVNEANAGVQAAGFYDREKLMGAGLPLQPYFNQVNMTGKNQVTHADSVITIPDYIEMLNDGGGSQLLGCEDANGKLHIYEAERLNNEFSLTSYIVWTTTGPVGYPHDSGDAGTWIGGPSGTPTITYHEVNESTVSPDLALHYQVVVSLMNGATPPYFEYGIITVIW